MNIEPQKTIAIVVGIEKYSAGNSWNLTGPAHDACRLAKWLYEKQVPLKNLALFISPLTENLSLPPQLKALAATENHITDFIENSLSHSSADLLYFYWGGHGVTTAGERRLFYADATTVNKKNLDLNALLAFLRTDYFRARTISRQIVLVDTCANYVEKMHMVTTLPQRSFPNGQPLENRQQYVLMAAKPGELAKNLDTEQTGLFTKEFMVELEKSNNLLPDMLAITQNLQARFEVLRAEKKIEQTPVYWIRHWDSSEELMPLGNQSEVKAKTPATYLLVLLVFAAIGLLIYRNDLFFVFLRDQIKPPEESPKTSQTTELGPTEKFENKQPLDNTASVSVKNVKNNDLSSLQNRPENPFPEHIIPNEYLSLTVSEIYRITKLDIEEKINQKSESNLWILTWSGTGNRENLWRYELLRRTPSTPWEVISTFNRMQETTYSENLDTLKPWEIYNYQVIPILEKNKTRGISKTITRITPLPAPTHLLPAQVSKKIRLTWEWSSPYPVKHFAVYKFKYTPYAKSAYEKGHVKVVKQATVTSLEWEDQISTGCQSDYYLVRAIDDRNQEGIEAAPVNMPVSIVY